MIIYMNEKKISNMVYDIKQPPRNFNCHIMRLSHSSPHPPGDASLILCSVSPDPHSEKVGRDVRAIHNSRFRSDGVNIVVP